MVHDFVEGEKVTYTNENGVEEAVIKAVHTDDSPNYYTIEISEEGKEPREIQTVAAKLRKIETKKN